MLELSDFIADALASIVKGIQRGQASDVGDHIAPLIQGEKRNEHGSFHLKDDPANQATIVQFDVQVGTESEAGGAAKAEVKVKLVVVGAEIGAGGKLVSKSSNLHRLQFSIPIKIPRRYAQAAS